MCLLKLYAIRQPKPLHRWRLHRATEKVCSVMQGDLDSRSQTHKKKKGLRDESVHGKRQKCIFISILILLLHWDLQFTNRGYATL